MRSFLRCTVLTASLLVATWGMQGCSSETQSDAGKMGGPMGKMEAGNMGGPMERMDTGKMSGAMDKEDTGKMSGAMDKMETGKMPSEKR
jgi:hypothetical protein